MSDFDGGNSTKDDNINPFTGEVEPQDVGDTASDTDTDEPNEEDQEGDKSTVEKPKEEEESEEKGELQGEARRMVIDAIEKRFEKMDAGSMSAEELYEFFKSNKDIELTADKSKKVKDRYRSFIKKYESGAYATDEDADEDEEQEVKTEKKKEAKPGDTGYVSREDLITILSEYDDKKQNEAMYKVLRQERDSELEDFATSRGIKDNDYDALKKNATALFELNSGWTFKEALEASNRALFKTKDKPVTVSSRSQNRDERIADEDDVDFSQGSALVNPSDWGL